jgi:hypothetical protein
MTTTLLPDPDTKAEDEKPSRAWRNKWRALRGFRMTDGRRVPDGYSGFEKVLYPSKNAAAQAATRWMLSNVATFGQCLMSYEGAFEVKE